MPVTRSRRPTCVAASLAVALWLVSATASSAQQTSPEGRPALVTVIDADGAGPDFDLRRVGRGFSLFGAGDAAVGGMRMTGNLGAGISNYGPCSNGLIWYMCQYELRVNNPGVTTRAPFFDVEWAVAAPPTEYLKIRQVAPSVANATGGGWTAGTNMGILGRPPRWGPADGSLGRMFSGVTTTTDGSCRDRTGFGNGSWVAGYQMLPVSDCPEAWGSEGWQGARPIPQAGWETLFAQRGDGFRFDFWRVPAEYTRQDEPSLGTGVHIYGETSDYSSDVLPYYGSVVPGGTGAPTYQGYPLGLLLHFDAFAFADPRLANAYFVQVLIINRSAEVWGTGVDYDSLYLGFSNGTLFNSSNNSRYAVPDRGMVLHHNSNVQGPGGPCDDAWRKPEGGGCTGNAGLGRGYGASALAIMFLKSPLGDLRNKLFTRTVGGQPCQVGVDPFCRPGHPSAGDTLTFNHMNFGDYSSALQISWDIGAKAAWGFIAGNEEASLAGRDPASLTDRILWRGFRSEDWPGSSTLVGAPNKAHYNKYVPPASPPWDYDHDGVPDTVALATCGRYGCAVVDSDTMPGGFLNRRGNIGGHQSFGPFALAAGDTTALVYAMVGGGDSAEVWAQIEATLDQYLRLYPAPAAPPRTEVLSTQVTPATGAWGTPAPAVQLFFSDAAETWVDPYLMQLAADVETSPGYADLRGWNPWLPDSLRVRARDNLARLEIYKSCDAGVTWTSDADCSGDRATDVDRTALGAGWQAYAVLERKPGADVPNTFTDASVMTGRTYLYTIVARSRGATFAIDSAGVPLVHTFVPSLANPLSRVPADPNVVAVYVPASKPAGYEPARVAVTARPAATVPFAVTVSDAVSANTYRAVFGTEIEVARDSLTETHQAFGSLVTVQRRETVDAGGVGVDSILRRESFTYEGPQVFLVAGTAVTDLGTVPLGGDTVRTTTRYGRTVPDTGLAFVVADSDGMPVFGSTVLLEGRATPSALLGRPDYPGFTVELDNAVRGQFDAASESQFRGPQTRSELKLTDADTIVPRDRVNDDMVQWLETSSTATGYGRGNYSVAWGDDPFGVARAFVINLANPAATVAEVQATLNARQVITTGLTDRATADLLGVAQSDLVAVKLPFSLRNTTFGRAVSVAMVQRTSNLIVLGSLTDTISVEIPDDVWVPGDRLYFLETVTEDSTVSGRLVMDSPTQPHQWSHVAETFSAAVLGCQTPRTSCNPLTQGTPGATGYEPMRAGDSTRFGYYVGLEPTAEYGFAVDAAVTAERIATVTDSALRRVRVVPNPFVVYAAFQTSLDQPRLLFTNMPPRGTLRIYTVNAQFVQQITWAPADLEGDGDLVWNLRSLDDVVVNAGLYVWVLTAPSDPTDPQSAPVQARGKFVIVR